MKKFLFFMAFSLGIVLGASAALQICLVGANAGNILCLWAGVFFICACFVCPKLSGKARMCADFFLCSSVLFILGMFGFIAVQTKPDTVTFQEQCVLVLGGGIRGEKV